jgi:glycosyltransferase involved in cell wall biosynthesis
MDVLQVVTSVAEEASGPSHSVPALCRAVGSLGARVTLHTLAPAPESLSQRLDVAQYERWIALHHLGISPSMKRGLRGAAASADIAHVHGLWQMPTVYPAWAVRGTSCRLVYSPRGTLSAWALGRSRLIKKTMWLACQGRAVRSSACLHATAESESEEIRRLGLRAPVAVIPNGVELAAHGLPAPAEDGPRRLLFLGRIHPKKGVDLLIRAWRGVQASFPDWVLEIVGPDEGGYLARMQELAGSIGAERVAFPGPAYGTGKAEAYRRADLFVLPTHSENFGMAVAEALAQGVPAVVTKGAPWAGLEEHGCGWWIDPGEGPLTECLRAAMATPHDELRARGGRGRDWMERDYSWGRVGGMMHETYLWLLGGGPAPPWIRRG